MKKILHTSLLTTACLLCSIGVMAEDFESGGIYYNITDETNKTVAVTYRGSEYNSYDNEYTGSIEIPESVAYNGVTYSVTSIEGSTFSDCSSLTSVTIPNSVTSIGNMAFYDCESLAEVNLSNSLTLIDTQTFSFCKSLTEITIPNSVTTIGAYAFSECSGLIAVTIPNSVTEIGTNAFNNCTGLKAVYISDIAAWCIIDFKNTYSNPLSYAHNLYLDNEIVTELTIPDSVTMISKDAFTGCTSLTSVTIPNSVTSIESGAFEDCLGLTEVTVQATTPPALGYGVFSKTIPIFVPEGCANVYKSASNWSNLCILERGDALPVGARIAQDGIYYKIISDTDKSVEVITSGNYTGKIVIPATVTHSYDNTTYSVTSIGDLAFLNCLGLTEITLPNTITKIGESAFSGCSSLTSIAIPASVALIDMWAFRSCPGLTAMSVDADNTVYDSRNNCNAIIETATNTLIAGCSNTIIPNGVTSIGSDAFFYCVGLTEVTIPNSVTSIGADAFASCDSLTQVTIGSGVTSIGNYAFYGCMGLTEINCHATTPPDIKEYTFHSGTYNEATLYVVSGYKDAYSNALYWSNFSHITDNLAGVNGIEVDNCHITIVGGRLNIEGIESEAAVNIYNVNGALLRTTTVAQVADVVLPRGIYLVRVGDAVKKVVL